MASIIIANLFGWYWKKNNKRRFRYAYVTVARGNGKSTLMASIAIMTYILTKVYPQVLLAATSRKQADSLLNAAVEFIKYSPALSKVLEPLQYAIRFKNKKQKMRQVGNKTPS